MEHEDEVRLRRELLRADHLWRDGRRRRVLIPGRLYDLLKADADAANVDMNEHVTALLEVHLILSSMDDRVLKRVRAVERRLTPTEQRIGALERRLNAIDARRQQGEA